MITKKNILDKTNYGLKIFAFILRQYYPNTTVLKVKGTVCELTHNPFSKKSKQSLKIFVINKRARFQDMSDASFYGDVFDFAQLYFKKTTELELLLTINEVLKLNLEEKTSTYDLKQERINELLDSIPETDWRPKFSYFSKNLFNLTPSKIVGIKEVYTMLTNPNRKHHTDQLRLLSNEKDQKAYKKQYFDYVTFSGVFTKRNNTNLARHSNLLTIDIDGIPNRKELLDIRKTLLNDPYFPSQLLFISPRGNGLKWIIKISLDEVSHSEYFQAVTNYIKTTYNIEIDASGKDVSRGCLLPYDPIPYINPKYKKDVEI